MTVALNSDIGLVCGLTKSCHTSADILLNPDDNVLKGMQNWSVENSNYIFQLYNVTIYLSDYTFLKFRPLDRLLIEKSEKCTCTYIYICFFIIVYMVTFRRTVFSYQNIQHFKYLRLVFRIYVHAYLREALNNDAMKSPGIPGVFPNILMIIAGTICNSKNLHCKIS